MFNFCELFLLFSSYRTNNNTNSADLGITYSIQFVTTIVQIDSVVTDNLAFE